MLSEAELCPAKGFWGKGAPASWVLCACYSNFVKDDFLSWLGARLTADLGEEGLKPVIIVLTPFLVRVVMALGALQALELRFGQSQPAGALQLTDLMLQGVAP